jgi:signal transduction histidine kinase
MTATASTLKRLTTRPGRRLPLDAAIAASALVGSLSQLAHGGVAGTRPESAGLDLAGVALAVCATAPLIAWRRFPLGVFAATATASVVLAGLGYPLDLILGPIAALYLLAASRDKQTPWTRCTTATVVGLLAAYLAASAAAQATFPGIELLHSGLAASGAWFAGERTRLRQEQIAEIHQRAVRAEREAERERLLAIAEERARLARDLHDSAGHAISVIAVRAGAARLRHPQDRSLPALTAIEELARQTATEIDQIVDTLRDGGAVNGAVQAPVGLASLDTLIAHHTTTGLEVTFDRAGTPRPLSSVADQAAYRILQEALTNAARHGTGIATITFVFDDDALDLTVTNPVSAANTPRPGGGHGLTGMQERATLLGGSLDAERVNGAFRVHARIPYGGRPT